MKNLILFLCAISLSGWVSATETSSFKTATGQTLTIGDSLNDLVQRTAQSPDSLKSTTLTRDGKEVPAMRYDYSIGQIVYSVTVLNEKIVKIEWQDKM